MQDELVYDLTAKHQLQLAITERPFAPRAGSAFIDIGEVQGESMMQGVAVVTWRYRVARFILTQKIAAVAERFRNTNRNGLEAPPRASRSDVMYRADWTLSPSHPRVMFEGGGEVRRSSESRFEQGLELLGRFFPGTRRRSARRPPPRLRTVFARLTRARVVIAPGVRVDHSTLTSHTSASPWIKSPPTVVVSGCVAAAASIARSLSLPR